MTKRNLRYAGLGLAVLTVGALAACGSSDSPTTPTPGSTAGAHSGGATGTAGAPAGTAGTPAGTAGAGTGTAGATGGAGAASTSFACTGTKPTAALITSFASPAAAATAGNFTFLDGIPGGTFTYQPGELTLTADGSTLEVKGTVNNYDGFGLYFNSCTDASAYTGVSFSVKGNAGYTGKLNFRVQSNADTAVDTTNMKGTCVVPAGTTDTYPLCHNSAKDIPVTATATVVTVNFADLAGGVPTAVTNGSDVVGLEWAFNWTAAPAAGTGGASAGGAGGAANGPFTADITIDDVKFIGGTGPTGGAGAGAGGAAATAGAGGASAGASPGGAGGSGGAAAGAGGTAGGN